MKSIATAKMRGQASNNQQPDFGTYHHSTPRASQKIREKVNILFTRVFRNLPFARDDTKNIYDVYCSYPTVLVKKYTVVAPDLRGFGDSSKPTTGLMNNIRTILETLQRVLSYD